jgi:hypothetical protein
VTTSSAAARRFASDLRDRLSMKGGPQANEYWAYKVALRDPFRALKVIVGSAIRRDLDHGALERIGYLLDGCARRTRVGKDPGSGSAEGDGGSGGLGELGLGVGDGVAIAAAEPISGGSPIMVVIFTGEMARRMVTRGGDGMSEKQQSDEGAEISKSIDKALTERGWVVQEQAASNPKAAEGVAVRGFALRGKYGRADYILFVRGQAVGVIEVAESDSTASGVDLRSDRYVKGLPTKTRAPIKPLPFGYLIKPEVSSPGQMVWLHIWFTDATESVRSRASWGIDRPQRLWEMVEESLRRARAPDLYGWENVLNFRPPDGGVRLLQKTGSGAVLVIEDGVDEVSLDHFSAQIDRLPPGMSDEGLLEVIRTRFNDFVDDSISSFEANDPESAGLWASEQPLGALLRVKASGYWWLDSAKGAVAVGYRTPKYWRFSSVKVSDELEDLARGVREFGVKRLENGPLVAYTRAAYRLSRPRDRVFRRLTEQRNDQLWFGFAKRVVQFVKAKGGAASLGRCEAYSFHWGPVSVAHFNPIISWPFGTPISKYTRPIFGAGSIPNDVSKALDQLRAAYDQARRDLSVPAGGQVSPVWDYVRELTALGCAAPNVLKEGLATDEVVSISIDPNSFVAPVGASKLNQCQLELMRRIGASTGRVSIDEVVNWASEREGGDAAGGADRGRLGEAAARLSDALGAAEAGEAAGGAGGATGDEGALSIGFIRVWRA